MQTNPVDWEQTTPIQGSRHSYLATYFVLFVAWVAVSWPAFAQFWWHADDYTRAISFDPWFSVGQGRPLEILVPYLIHQDYLLQSLWFHQAIRLLQAALHLLTALLLIRFFRPLVGYWVACGAVLFFLFWPFHAEAVLWISALAYPWAAAMSLCGLLLIGRTERRYRWLGTFVVVGAMFTNQAAALAALVAWTIFHGIFFVQQNRFKEGLFQEGIFLALGYLVGGVLSRLMIFWIHHGAARAAWAGSVQEKLAFWVELNRQYLASPNYPWVLTILLLALVGLVVLLVIVQWWRRQVSTQQATAVALLLALLSVLPYGVVLLTAESSPAWRILYLAPLLSVLVWLLLHQLLPPHRWLRYGSALVLVLFLSIVIPMNRWNAADYVTVFQQDQAQLQRIEETAARHQPPLHQVVIATYPDYLRTWELHDVTYMHYDSKKSAFLRDWTVVPFLEHFSTLAPIPASNYPFFQDPVAVQACVTLCLADDQQQPWQLLVMPDAQTLCVCP
ncbi:MAG: hypothetical protein KDE53_38580 [Caldilineaceae bacterium]|nr:hypothetical protein [Caldilineaceae bacterium]